MKRPLWSDAGTDAAAVAQLLDDEAQKVGDAALEFLPVALPKNAKIATLHQAALARVRRQLSERHGDGDRILAQEVRAIDDLVRASNLMMERLREWYGLHAPEAVRLVPDAEKLAGLVADHGAREGVFAALDRAQDAALSIGSELDEADLAILQTYAASLRSVQQTWRALEGRVKDLMQDVAPNLASVVGEVIGARMIALAGGLQRLAGFPAGTVQLLGAETALFRHIKEGTKPPKHGILFQHIALHSAPPWQRGALARAYAQTAALAAKADAFSGNDLREELSERLEKQLERIRRERAKPPQRKPRQDDRGQGGYGGQRGQRGGPPRGRGGPPHRGGPPNRGGPRGPRRDEDRRGPPRGPRRDDDRRGPPRRDGPGGPGGPRGPPRGGDRAGGFGPRDGGRGPPRVRDDDRRGPPHRDGPPRRDGPSGPRGPPRGGYDDKPRRKGPGAFRGDGGPAKTPGKGKGDKKGGERS